MACGILDGHMSGQFKGIEFRRFVVTSEAIGEPRHDFLKEIPQEILRPAAFRPHFTMGLAQFGKTDVLPTGSNRLSGAEHIQFEVIFHEVTSRIRGWIIGGNTYKRLPKGRCKGKSLLLSRKKEAFRRLKYVEIDYF